MTARLMKPKGKLVLIWYCPRVCSPRRLGMTSVATTADGRIWVLDTLRQVVQVYDLRGAFLGRVGGLGQEAGAFYFPSALATNGKTRLYVVERVGARLTTFRITEPLAQADP